MMLTLMKSMLWAGISALWLITSERYVLAQSQIESLGPCQRLIQLSWRYATSEEASSSQALLRDQVEAVCLINNEQPRTDDDSAIATDDNPSSEHFTVPSLWWRQQQMINDRLVDSWHAYNNDTSLTAALQPHIDVIVNGQIWPSLSYLERYWLLTQFGESAKTYGYQLRIFTGNRPVGLQVCDFEGDIVAPAAPTNSEEPAGPTAIAPVPVCAIVLNYFDEGAIRANRQR